MEKEEPVYWYILYTAPRAEKKVLDRLKAIIKNEEFEALEKERNEKVKNKKGRKFIEEEKALSRKKGTLRGFTEKDSREELEVYLPLYYPERQWSDRKKIVETTLYTSYIFVRCKKRILFEYVHKMPGVAWIVYYGGQPAVLPGKEIDAIEKILQYAENGTVYIESQQQLQLGDEVQVRSQDMKVISGKIKKIGKKEVRLYTEQLGATVIVKINDVTPVKKNS